MQKFEINKADFREHPHLTRLSDVMTFSANKEEGSKVESLRNGQQMAETPEDAIGRGFEESEAWAKKIDKDKS